MRPDKRVAVSFVLALSLIIFTGVFEGAHAERRNPCSDTGMSIRKKVVRDPAALMKLGEALWTDATLGRSGNSCSTCHPGGARLKSGAYPKYIAMTGDILTLDQMINYCMMNPMRAEPLPWNSLKLTALAAYASANSREAEAPGMNPCSAKNPCNMKNSHGRD